MRFNLKPIVNKCYVEFILRGCLAYSPGSRNFPHALHHVRVQIKSYTHSFIFRDCSLSATRVSTPQSECAGGLQQLCCCTFPAFVLIGCSSCSLEASPFSVISRTMMMLLNAYSACPCYTQHVTRTCGGSPGRYLGPTSLLCASTFPDCGWFSIAFKADSRDTTLLHVTHLAPERRSCACCVIQSTQPASWYR